MNIVLKERAFGVKCFMTLKAYFKKEMFDSLGRFCSPKARISYHEGSVAEGYLLRQMEQGKSISEAVFICLNDIKTTPKCEFCNKTTEFSSFKNGYRQTCMEESCLRKSYGKNPHIPTQEERVMHSKRMKVNNPMFDEKVAEKVHKTQRANNGGLLSLHTEENKEKALNGRYDRYGTFSPKSNLYKSKDYISRSGKIYKIQGYEWMALDILFQDFKESEVIVCGRGHSFKYEFNGSKRYYPDIFIPKKNKYIEVKSQYTFEKMKEQNLAKADAVKKQGYEFEFWIFDKDKNLNKVR